MNEWTENLMNIGIELGPIVLLTLIAIIFSRTVIYKSLLVYASASDTKHDDAFVNSLKKPLTLIPFVPRSLAKYLTLASNADLQTPITL